MSEIFNDTLSLSSDSGILHGLVKDKLLRLREVVHSTSSELRPAVLNALRNAPASAILSSTYDQLLSVLDAHNVDNSVHVVNFSTELINLGNTVNLARSCFSPNTRYLFILAPLTCSSNLITTPTDWLVISSKISEILNRIAQVTSQVIAQTTETTLRPSLTSYFDLVTHINVQWQISSAAFTCDVRIEGFDREECVWFLNDFAFITFPFGYTLREAAA